MYYAKRGEVTLHILQVVDFQSMTDCVKCEHFIRLGLKLIWTKDLCKIDNTSQCMFYAIEIYANCKTIHLENETKEYDEKLIIHTLRSKVVNHFL